MQITEIAKKKSQTNKTEKMFIDYFVMFSFSQNIITSWIFVEMR